MEIKSNRPFSSDEENKKFSELYSNYIEKDIDNLKLIIIYEMSCQS